MPPKISTRRGPRVNYLKLSQGKFAFKPEYGSDSENEFVEEGKCNISSDSLKSFTLEDKNASAGEVKTNNMADASEDTSVGEMTHEDIEKRLREAAEERKRLDEKVAKQEKMKLLKKLEQENEQLRARVKELEASSKVSHKKHTAETDKKPTEVPADEAGSSKQANSDPDSDIEALRRLERLRKQAQSQLKGLGLCESDEEEEPVGQATSRGRKLKSGLEARASDIVINPQIWPHVALQYEFLSGNLDSNNIGGLGFSDLDFRLLVAGELEIITSDSISDTERYGRLKILKQLAYHMGYYDWEVLRGVYAAIVRKIELGLYGWDSDFSRLEQMILTKAMVKSQSDRQSSRPKSQSAQFTTAQKDRTWYCHKFQNNMCNVAGESHPIQWRGQTITVHHICSRCWSLDKKKMPHRESDSACPHKTA